MSIYYPLPSVLLKKSKSINRKGLKGPDSYRDRQRSQSSVPIAIGSYRNEIHCFNFISFTTTLRPDSHRDLRLKRTFSTAPA
jgi:hypothetical protein